MSDQSIRQQISERQGGRGRALRYITNFVSAGVPTSIGQAPTAGTNCSVFLDTGNDPAYTGALVIFVVEQFGKLAQFDQQTITAPMNALGEIAMTAGSCAADAWSIYLQLPGPALPAAPLISAVIAFGVENSNPGGGAGGTYTGAFPIVVTGTVISIDPSATPWVQVGGTGGIIEAVDPTASVQAGGGSATGSLAVAFSGGAATGASAFAGGDPTALADGVGSFAWGFGAEADGENSVALAYGLASGDFSFALQGNSVGTYSFAQGGLANGYASFASYGGIANGLGSFAGPDGTANGRFSFASCGGVANDEIDVAFGNGSVATGGNNFAAAGGQALGSESFAAAGGVASGLESVALCEGSGAGGEGSFSAAGYDANFSTMFASGIGNNQNGGPFVSIGDDAVGVAIQIDPGTLNGPGELGFFGAAPVVQQTGPATAAGAVYTATEQAMLNAIYTALQNYGLILT